MNRRILLTVVAAVAAISLSNANRADAALFGLFSSNGGACEAHAGCDSGPSDCGGCGAETSCCKHKHHWNLNLNLFNRKSCGEPTCCAPEPTPCDSCDSCCRRPILDYLRNLLTPSCHDHGCGAPQPSCGGCGV